jgi:hypothetical protein
MSRRFCGRAWSALHPWHIDFFVSCPRGSSSVNMEEPFGSITPKHYPSKALLRSAAGIGRIMSKIEVAPGRPNSQFKSVPT